MKKLFGLLAGLAFATAFADPVELVPTAKSFEIGEDDKIEALGAYDYASPEYLEDSVTQVNLWLYGPGGSAATVKEFGDEVQYSYSGEDYVDGARYDLFAPGDGTDDNYLSIETAANAPLFRTLADCSSETQKVAIGENGIMIDTLVKFTGAEEDPVPGAEDKLIVWLKGVESETDPEVVAGETNLYITAGLVGDETTTATNIQITSYADGTSLQVVPDRWYRLTVKAMGNIFAGGGALTNAGFLVYLDGKLVKGDVEAGLVSADVEMSGLAADHNDNGTLFPSLVRDDATLTAVGFEGTGGIDDLRIAEVSGEDSPRFVQEFAINYSNINDGVYDEGVAWSWKDDNDVRKFYYGGGDGTVYLPAASDFVAITHEFAGWYTNENFLGDAIVSFPSSDAEEKAFYAKWQPVQNDFEFTPPVIAHATLTEVLVNGVPATPTAGVYAIPQGASVAVTYTADAYYSFGGNTTLPAYIQSADSASDILAAINAEENTCTAVSYPISYLDNQENADMPFGYKERYTVEDEDFELVNPVAKTGYDFAGWYTNENFLGERILTNDCSVGEFKTYFAKWAAVEYTVSYLESDGQTAVSMPAAAVTSYTVEDGSCILWQPNEKVGYDFNGWYTNVTAQGEFVGETVSGFDATDAEDKTFYARWVVANYDITYQFVDSEASTNIAEVTENLNPSFYTFGEGVEFDAEKVTLAGFTCVGFQIGGVDVQGIASDAYGDKTVTVLLEPNAAPPEQEPLPPGGSEVVTEEELDAATNALREVSVPTAVATALTDEQETAYKSLFHYVAESDGQGGYVVSVDFTEAAKAALEDEADAQAAALPLATLADGTASESTLTDLTPGLYYSVVYGTGVTAISSEGTRAMAGSDGTATLTYPAKTPGAQAGFYRIKVSATAE